MSQSRTTVYPATYLHRTDSFYTSHTPPATPSHLYTSDDTIYDLTGTTDNIFHIPDMSQRNNINDIDKELYLQQYGIIYDNELNQLQKMNNRPYYDHYEDDSDYHNDYTMDSISSYNNNNQLHNDTIDYKDESTENNSIPPSPSVPGLEPIIDATSPQINSLYPATQPQPNHNKHTSPFKHHVANLMPHQFALPPAMEIISDKHVGSLSRWISNDDYTQLNNKLCSNNTNNNNSLLNQLTTIVSNPSLPPTINTNNTVLSSLQQHNSHMNINNNDNDATTDHTTSSTLSSLPPHLQSIHGSTDTHDQQSVELIPSPSPTNNINTMVLNNSGNLVKRKKYMTTPGSTLYNNNKQSNKHKAVLSSTTPHQSTISRTTGDIRTDMSFHYYTDQHNTQHSIRILTVTNLLTDHISSYAHAADLGSCIERKSNISRLFSQFRSPTEKVLMNVCGSHNHTIGQESNVLTVAGIYRFFKCSKMREQNNYKQWITNHIIPILMNTTNNQSVVHIDHDCNTDNNNSIDDEPDIIYTTVKPNRVVNHSNKRMKLHHHQKQNRNKLNPNGDDNSNDDDDSSDETFRLHGH